MVSVVVGSFVVLVHHLVLVEYPLLSFFKFFLRKTFQIVFPDLMYPTDIGIFGLVGQFFLYLTESSSASSSQVRTVDWLFVVSISSMVFSFRMLRRLLVFCFLFLFCCCLRLCIPLEEDVLTNFH